MAGLPDERTRISDRERDDAVATLRSHTAAGYLTLDEFDERLAEVLAARTDADLRVALRELPAVAADAADDDPRRRYWVKVRNQAAGWASTNGICIGIWAATDSRGFWPIWPLLFTSVGLAGLLIRGAEGEEERERERQRHLEEQQRHRAEHERQLAEQRHVGPPHQVPPGSPHASGRALATVLFVDIVDSTARAAAMGDAAWRRLLDRYETMVADRVDADGGQVVKLLGDGAVATFPVPASAVRAAAALGEAAAADGYTLRAGLHTGEVEVREGDIAGIAVHLAQRVCAAAEPGEVLVTRTVVDLVTGAGLSFDDRGDRQLKGFDVPTRLFALTA